MKEAVIVAAARTPIGKCRGVLAGVPAHELGGLALREAVRRSGIDPAGIEDVIFANLMNHEINNMGRMVGLTAGLPYSVPGVTLDRQCGASLNAIAYASILIQAGYGDVYAAGGVESDSRRTYTMDKPTTPYQIMPPKWSDIRVAPEQYGSDNMGQTAENIAELYKITRRDCDEFSAISHQKAAKAWDAGYFDSQIIAVDVPLGKGKFNQVSKDEALRPETTADGLANLSAVFKKDGVVTAGNSSPMSDGAGAVIVMEKQKAKDLGLPILATFKRYTAAGVEPRLMGLGPVAATNKLLKEVGMSLQDIDLIEMNEAFAAQSLACIRDLNINLDKLNVNGGAIALGHPLAGSGAILVTKMLYELERRNLATGLITFCVGGGQGVSMLLERE